MKQTELDFTSKLTHEQAVSSMSIYARSKSIIDKTIADEEFEIAELKKKNEDTYKLHRDTMAEQEAILKSYAEQNVTEDKKSIKLPTGTIGFKQDPPSVVLPKENEEAIINLMRSNDTMNTYVKVKTVLSLNKELIIQNKDEDEVKDKWKDFMITIKQDDRFFIKLK